MIFFDEPSASLDHEGIEDFRRILADLKALGKTVVIAEHRLYFLADLYDRLHVMAGAKSSIRSQRVGFVLRIARAMGFVHLICTA